MLIYHTDDIKVNDARLSDDIDIEMDNISLITDVLNYCSNESDNRTLIKNLSNLDDLLYELTMELEEQRLFNYFDKQYRIYLIEQMRASPPFAKKIKGLVDLVKKSNIDIITEIDVNTHTNITNDKNTVSKTDAKINAETVVKSGANDNSKKTRKPDLNRLFMPASEAKFVINVAKKTFIDSIIDTYKDDSAIIAQFLCDFHRQTIRINDMPCENIDDFFLQLSRKNRKTSIINNDGKEMSILMLILLLTCQSTHYLSYLYPYNVVNMMRENAITTSKYIDTNNNDDMTTKKRSNDAKTKHELNKNNIPLFEDPIVNYYVMNGDGMNIIDIVIDDIVIRPDIECIIRSNYKIYDIHNDKKIYDISAETIFNERSEHCLIKYIVSSC